MDPALVSLLAANIAFVGTHFAMSHPLRAGMVRALGEGGFIGAYSLVSLATFAWIVLAFRAAPSGDLGGSGQAGWIAASILTLPALVLFAGSLAGNPALPQPDAKKLAQREPSGVFRVTRHPMMWGFALWAISHIVLWWSWRTTITAAEMLFLALVGAHMQDRKKRRLMGEAWGEWEASTTYWPRWTRLLSVGWIWWTIGAALWLALSWLHGPLGGVPAGIWRYT